MADAPTTAEAVAKLEAALADNRAYCKAMIAGDSSACLAIEERYGVAGYPPEIAGLGIAPNLADVALALAAMREATRDAGRYRWLREKAFGVRDRRGIESFELPSPTPCMASIMTGSLAQHLDAAIDAAKGTTT